MSKEELDRLKRDCEEKGIPFWSWTEPKIVTENPSDRMIRLRRNYSVSPRSRS